MAGGPSGRTLITTRLPAVAVRGPRRHRVIPVPGLNRREALSYLSSRLTDHPDQRIEALDLGEDLDGLPLALAQATAVINARQQGCREYRARWPSAASTCRGGRGLGHGAGHLVAGRRVRARASAVRAGLADAGADRHDGPPRDPRRGADQPGRLQLYRRPARARPGGADQNMVRAAINNLAAAGPGHHRSGQPGAHRADARQRPGRRAGLAAPGRPRAGRAGRRRRAAGDLAGRRRRAAPRSGAAGLRRGAAGQRRRHAVEDRGPSAAVPGRAVAGEQQAVRRRHRVLAVHAGHQHPAARPRARERRGGQGPARRGLRGGRAVRRGHLGVPGRAGRPGAEPGTRARGDHRGPGSPGPRLPERRAGPRTPWPCTSGRWPTPNGCSAPATRSRWLAGQPGRRLPAAGQPREAIAQLRDAAQRCRAAARRRATRPRWARAPAWPPPTRPTGRPRTRSSSTSGRWPTRSGCTGATIPTPSRPGPAWPRRTARPGS